MIERNALGHATPTAPTFYYNAINDELIAIDPLDKLVAQYCRDGADISYFRDPVAQEHIEAIPDFLAFAVPFLEQRFAGRAVPSTCPCASGSSAQDGADAAPAPESFTLQSFHERSPIGVIGGDENFGCRAADATRLRLRACRVELRARVHGRSRTSVLGHGMRTAADRRSFKVDVNLTKAGRALMRRRPRGFHATLTTTGTDSVGRTRTTHQRVILHRGH